MHGISGPSDFELHVEYSQISVRECIYCRSDEVAVKFVFLQPVGLPLAVPGRIGLCQTCLALLRDGAFSAILSRTRGTDFEDFADDDVLSLIRASAPALPD